MSIIKAITNITLKSQGVRESVGLFGQRYSFSEEGDANVSRKVAPGEVEEIVVVPDTDIQSSIKFVHISATGEVSDLEASRVALSVRTYETAKSATLSNDLINSFGDPTIVFGALSNDRVGGDKNLSQPISIKGGAIGIILAKDSDGLPTDYPDNNALPLTLHVENKGIKQLTVNVKSIYDPSPADHHGNA